jgi:hypothetical protein
VSALRLGDTRGTPTTTNRGKPKPVLSGVEGPGAGAALAKVRALCLGFPEVSERPSHGAPTFFIRDKKSFLNFVDNHHGDGKLAVIVAAPPGFQGTIVAHDPVTYYLPAYVARLGWVGVRLDQGTAWDEIAGVIEQAYLTVAPRELAARLRRG